MIDRDHELSVTKQAEAVGIARSTVYYLPRPVSVADLALMRQIDKLRPGERHGGRKKGTRNKRTLAQIALAEGQETPVGRKNRSRHHAAF
jgi:hypothetical protein